MELKTIQVSDILANFSQPREKFDQEKIKELSESILSNGLINPITVRVDPKRKGKYMIVAGERRWMAHRLAKLKTIQAVVKKYKNDGEWMVQSLIENVHREDLKEYEKAKYLMKIKQLQNIETNRALSKIVGLGEVTIHNLMNLNLPGKSHISKSVQSGEITEHHFRSIQNLGDKKTEIKVLEKIKKEDLSSAKTEKLASVIKKATPDVKDALLNDKISVQQAEDISKISNEKARSQALKQTQQHKKLADIIPKVMKNKKPELTDAIKKQFLNQQKFIFDNLYNAKDGMIKANRFLRKANELLFALLSRQFEYGLPEKTLKLSLTQLKSISDEMSKFNLSLDRFEELKENFIERIEDKN